MQGGMHTKSWRRHHGEPGMSLIELIIILAVLATLITLFVPSTVQQLTAARWNSTLDEMEALHSALIGDPDLIAQGLRSDFGYLGDMGDLPATLDDLVVQDGQPVYTFDSSKGSGLAGRGPTSRWGRAATRPRTGLMPSGTNTSMTTPSMSMTRDNWWMPSS